MDLYEQHKSILEMAVRQQGFHYRMPEGGQEAIDSGLVGESDPTWMYSDDRRAANGFTPHEDRHRAYAGAGNGLPVRALRGVRRTRTGTSGGPALRQLPDEREKVRDERARRHRNCLHRPREVRGAKTPRTAPSPAHAGQTRGRAQHGRERGRARPILRDLLAGQKTNAAA